MDDADEPGTRESGRVFTGADGVPLAAVSWGAPDRPAVLLLHGFGQARQAWRATGRRLAAQGFHAVAPDARGHGDSGRAPGGRYALDDFVRDARQVAGRLRTPVMVGASMGGLAALLAEAESPHPLCRGLVLVDIAPRWRQSAVTRILEFMRARPEGFDSLEQAAQAVARYLPHRDARRTLEGLKPYLRRRPDGRLAWHWDPALLDAADPEPESYHARLMAAALRLECPVLLVTGEHSDVIGEPEAREFLDAVPHAERASIPGARHMVAGDAFDAFTDAVSAFLDRIETPAGTRRQARSATA